MAIYRSRRAVLRLAVPFMAASLGVLAVSTVFAGSPGPNTIHVTQTGALTVDASGTWIWGEMTTAAKLSYAGYAIDWGDTTSGNEVGPYHIGDGTAATNVVMQPTDPALAASGSYGPVSHTYARAGTYTVCAILYDLGQVKPFKLTGYHSLQAGGTGRNTDNSVDQKLEVPALCATVEVTAPTQPVEATPTPTPIPTPTPFESFQGATSDPNSTPPPTSTSGPSSPDQGSPLLWLAIFFASTLASVLVLKTARIRR